MSTKYTGETHCCHSDALSMALGPDSPGTSVIEVLTGSPFGMTLHEDGRPFFAPAGWRPEIGVEAAMGLLGWTCERTAGDPDEAVAQLRKASLAEPVLAGPVEMGLLPYHPRMGRPIGVDHYLVAIGMEGDTVLIHDPLGHPFVTMSLEQMLTAWRTDTLSYRVAPYSTRVGFRRVREVDVPAAIRASLQNAVKLLEGPEAGAAAEGFADIVEAGLNQHLYYHMVDFMVCAGARRLADAAYLLAGAGVAGPAKVLEHQARLVGSLQLPLITSDYPTAAAALRKLAPTYEQLRQELLKVLPD
jgi:hypothetical protein